MVGFRLDGDCPGVEDSRGRREKRFVKGIDFLGEELRRLSGESLMATEDKLLGACC